MATSGGTTDALAQAAIQANLSPRYRLLDLYDRYVEGTQYDGRPPFMGADNAPLLERAPCIVYGIAKTAIKDLTSFMMGEGRWPFFSAGASENDEWVDDDWGLDEDSSELFERWLNGPFAKSARLRAVLPQATEMAMRGGSVALVLAIRRGLPHIESLPARWCEPTFDAATGQVTALVIEYPYIKEEFDDVKRAWVERCYLYRRVIDAANDTVFLPGATNEHGTRPDWKVDATQTVAHGLGFCPVVWYAFQQGEATPASYDGRALHQTLLDEIDALNLALSQRHKSAIYAGDPQLFETGVDETVNPAPAGRPARVTVEAQAGGVGPDGRPGKPIGVFTAGGGQGRTAVRRKGAGVVWRYPDPTSKVGMLSLPGDALTGITEHAEDIRRKVAEDMSVLLLDPSDIGALGTLSGRALAFMFARQISFADALRLDLQDNLFLPVVDMLLRLLLVVGRRSPGGLRLPGMTKLEPVLAKFERALAVEPTLNVTEGAADQDGDELAGVSWFGPRMELQWGRYFEASAEEEQAIVTMVVAAYTAKVIPLSIAVEKLRDVFRFLSVEEIIERIEEEADARMKRAQEMGLDGGAPKNGEQVDKTDDKQSDDEPLDEAAE